MKLVRFERDGREGWAVQDPASGAWHGATAGRQRPPRFDWTTRSARAAPRSTLAARAMRAQPVVDLTAVQLSAPGGRAVARSSAWA